jgi:hypothetical protein
VIGDSVILGSADAIRSVLGPGTVIDAVESREFDASVGIVRSWIESGQRGPIVIHLGTNALVRADDIEAVIAAAGLSHRLVLVNAAVPRWWEPQVNTLISEAVRRHPNVGLVDWRSIVDRDPSLMTEDQVHPNEEGRIVLAQAIQQLLTVP